MKATQNKLRDRVNGAGVKNEEHTSEEESRRAELLQPMKARKMGKVSLYINTLEGINGRKDHKR